MLELETTADTLLMTGQAAGSTARAAQQAQEEFLVKTVLEGNHELFGKLYNLYAPLVHGILLARVPPVEVDDLVQDIFLHALKKLHTLRNHAAFVQIEKRRSVFLLLAIAAIILMTLFAAGLWISLNSPMTAEIRQLPLPVEPPPTLPTRETDMARRSGQALKPKPVKTLSPAAIARAKERQEAAAAKQQVMLALRLASSKLRGAQKKARVTPTMIRNQHKLG